jgi:hypothetical protein
LKTKIYFKNTKFNIKTTYKKIQDNLGHFQIGEKLFRKQKKKKNSFKKEQKLEKKNELKKNKKST